MAEYKTKTHDVTIYKYADKSAKDTYCIKDAVVLCIGQYDDPTKNTAQLEQSADCIYRQSIITLSLASCKVCICA